jgi:hypothetical protein
VTTITIHIAGQAHELSIEDARQLHTELAKMFGTPIVIDKTTPVPYPVNPFAPPWVVTCSNEDQRKLANL